jgi:hypothetical protein
MLVGPFKDFSARAKAMIKKRVAVFFNIFLLLSAGASLSLAQVIHDPDEPALLTNIILAKVDGGLDIKLLCTFFSFYKAFDLEAPNRIVIDFYGVEDIAAPREIEVNHSGVLKIRAGMYLESVARVVLEVPDDMPPYEITPIRGGLKLAIRPRTPVPHK